MSAVLLRFGKDPITILVSKIKSISAKDDSVIVTIESGLVLIGTELTL